MRGDKFNLASSPGPKGLLLGCNILHSMSFKKKHKQLLWKEQMKLSQHIQRWIIAWPIQTDPFQGFLSAGIPVIPVSLSADQWNWIENSAGILPRCYGQLSVCLFSRVDVLGSVNSLWSSVGSAIACCSFSITAALWEREFSQLRKDIQFLSSS